MLKHRGFPGAPAGHRSSVHHPPGESEGRRRRSRRRERYADRRPADRAADAAFLAALWEHFGEEPFERGNLDAGRLCWLFGREVVPAEEPFDPASYEALLQHRPGRARAELSGGLRGWMTRARSVGAANSLACEFCRHRAGVRFVRLAASASFARCRASGEGNHAQALSPSLPSGFACRTASGSPAAARATSTPVLTGAAGGAACRAGRRRCAVGRRRSRRRGRRIASVARASGRAIANRDAGSEHTAGRLRGRLCVLISHKGQDMYMNRVADRRWSLRRVSRRCAGAGGPAAIAADPGTEADNGARPPRLTASTRWSRRAIQAAGGIRFRARDDGRGRGATMFDKILIANRGEIACRVIKTARRMGIGTVAVYSDADAGALHVRMADEAVHIGPPPASQSYIVIDRIMDAIRADRRARRCIRATASCRERAEFAAGAGGRGRRLHRPAGRRDRGDGRQDHLEEARGRGRRLDGAGPHGADRRRRRGGARSPREIGYPVMIKASRRRRRQGHAHRLERRGGARGLPARRRTRRRPSFGDDRIFIEKFVTQPRHIEIQVLGDSHGTCLYLRERECSIQRRNQKVIEEAPSPFLDAETRGAMGEQAVALAQAVGYCSRRHGRVHRRRRAATSTSSR